MKKLKSSLFNMVLSLGSITIISGAALAMVYSVTKEPISNAEQQKKIQAVSDVLPSFDNNPIADAVELSLSGDDKSFMLYPATSDGQFVGAAVESHSMSGFSGEITVMFGFDKNGTVTGYSVLQHAETPGLGAKMDEWFRDSVGNRSIIGRTPVESNMKVSKDGGDIDGITAATITSRAFLESLGSAFEIFQSYNSNNAR